MRSGAASSSASSSMPSARLTSGTLPGKRPQRLCVREDIGDCPDIDRTPDGRKLCKLGPKLRCAAADWSDLPYKQK